MPLYAIVALEENAPQGFFGLISQHLVTPPGHIHFTTLKEQRKHRSKGQIFYNINMTKACLYVHGKGGSADEAAHYKPLLPDYQLIGLDYKGTTPWQTKEELLACYHALSKQYTSISLIANSIGAYFSMNALSAEKMERAFFISPIVDMEQLITNLMAAARVTPEELKQKQEIETSFGQTLSWRYFSYLKEHPISWSAPTHILYGGKDTLTTRETISSFAKRIHASLTVMEEGEHWFHTREQMAFLDGWLKQHV